MTAGDPTHLPGYAEGMDPRTGRPFGDHGTAVQAIDFALDIMRNDDPETFLRCWREGDLEEWPEFYAWLPKAPDNDPFSDGPGPSLDGVMPGDLNP